jgi:hypothetical protein
LQLISPLGAYVKTSLMHKYIIFNNDYTA